MSSKKFNILIILLFLLLEGLTFLMWAAGTLMMALITVLMIHGGELYNSVSYLIGYGIAWGIIFAIPTFKISIQSATFSRGLARLSRDLEFDYDDFVKEEETKSE